MSTEPAPAVETDFTSGTFARVTGRVQGVSFRASVKEEADDFGLHGWVRNTRDGAVELLVGGEGPAVDALLKWCGKGPASASVESVDSREATTEELEGLTASGFEIRR